MYIIKKRYAKGEKNQGRIGETQGRPQKDMTIYKRRGERLAAEGRWFTVGTSRMEDIYKICAESFHGADHLHRTLEEEQTLVNEALTAASPRSGLANREEKP